MSAFCSFAPNWLRLRLLVGLIALGWLQTATAALPSPETHVQGSLVSADASIQPGRPFTVALRLEHEPHWHTYWLNPGTGLATTLAWKLPAGFTAGDIQWPAPIVLKDRSGTVVGNGYEGETLLLVTITPPATLATGTEVRLEADAEWLMCSDVCIPGGQALSLTLPVRGDPPSPNPPWHEKIAATAAGLPRPPEQWKVTASRDEKNITLHITPTADRPTQVPEQLHFFADDNLVAYELPQTTQPAGTAGSARVGFILTAPVSPDGPQNATELRGVLTSENGWRADGSMRGLRIDVPLTVASTAPGASLSTAERGAPTPGSTAAAVTPANSGLLATLLLAFVGGLILNLMPCVFPVLGIKILGFVNQAGHARSKVVAHGLVFTLGVLLSFWVLAGALAILRAGGDQLGWGFQLQSPAFVFSLTVLLLVFAMNMSGVFEFGLRATSVGGELQTKSGLAGSFFTGVLATVVATPCSAPFLAPALGAALALSTIESFTIFTAIALGLATPYLLLSIFPGAVKILPRPGAWMEGFKQFMAFPLYATVAYLVWVLAGQVSEEGFQQVLFGLVLVALGVWIYGRWSMPGASPARVRSGATALVLVAALGLWLGWPQATLTQTPGSVTSAGVAWQPWSPEAVQQLRAEGRIVYVDFTARWCATCQTNKKLVFHSDEVLQTFAHKKVAALRADWTNKDPRITAELARYGRSAVPFNVIWLPGRNEPVILPEILTPGTVLEALQSETVAVQ
ncbi:protein-disulfide reductase DsbD family protein [Opitutus terrae]|nr:thioredoxin family protein [Opitutus terrae]